MFCFIFNKLFLIAISSKMFGKTWFFNQDRIKI